jgi:hypothetical protein
LFLLQFVNLVFIVKQKYSHLNKRLNNWIIVTISRHVILMEENEMCIRHNMAADHVNITPLFVSSVGNIEGTLKQTDIHSLRQIYSELYDDMFYKWHLRFPHSCNYALDVNRCFTYFILVLIDVKVWGLANVVYAITCSVLFFNVTLVCHTDTKKGRFSRIFGQKLLIEGNFRKECVNLLKMFSLQLQVMTIQYTACGFSTLNLKLFASVVSVIASYIIIMVQVKW